MKEIPQRLYDSEINFSVSCFWDGGFEVKLGDEMNGFIAKAELYSWPDVLEWLDQTARKEYPESLYATGRWPKDYRVDGAVGARG